jgi:sugar phosphate isomerase/epimerase
MIDNIKLGIKLKTNEFNLLPEIYENQDLVDFIEVLIPPDFTSDDLITIKNFNLPYSIHFPHFTKKIDFGNAKQSRYNQKLIERVNSFENMFDQLRPLCYIVHPESGDIQLSMENIKKLRIKPLAIENMPYKFKAGGYRLAHDPKALEPYFDKKSALELCLDLNHVIKTAICLSLDYIELIKKFIMLKNPIHFHIADGNLNSEFDEHLGIGEGNYDIHGIKRILLDIETPLYLTFETPRINKENIEDDLTNMRAFIEY